MCSKLDVSGKKLVLQKCVANYRPVFPGAIYIISSWYRTYETASRVSIFYMASLLSSGFGGIVS